MQVAEDIFQVQLPLPFPLRIVNCYILRDSDGWTVVDTGIHYPPAEDAWRAAFAELGIDPRSITRIILTHAHPDHYGMAGWLQQMCGAPVLLAPGERAFAQRVWHNGEINEQAMIAFFREHGVPIALIDEVHAGLIETRRMTTPWPEMTGVIAPGSTVQLGARTFQAIPAPGHSEQHLVFYSAADRLLLCGDAVLTKITPNISRWPDGPPNPLDDFLHSLERLSTLDVALALPGHGPLIENFAERLVELRTHHDERLQHVTQAIGSSATAFEVCSVVFPTSRLSPHQLRFAVAETLAHLEYLVARGQLRRIEETIIRYQPID